MSFQDYAVYDNFTHRTDVDIVSPDVVDMFGQVAAGTQLPFTCATIGWLKTATSQFETIFSRDRNRFYLGFLTYADALKSNFILHELGRMPLTYSAMAEAEYNESAFYEEKTSSDVSSLPSQLVDWLNITYDQLSAITGISRSALFYLRQPGTTPRPGNAERLERLYALASLLVKRLGARGARVWLHSGQPAVWDSLQAGDLTAVERAVRSTFFKHPLSPQPRSLLRLGEVPLDLPTAQGGATLGLRRAERTPTRKRPRSE